MMDIFSGLVLNLSDFISKLGEFLGYIAIGILIIIFLAIIIGSLFIDHDKYE